MSIWSSVGKGCNAIDLHAVTSDEHRGQGIANVEIGIARTSWHDLTRIEIEDADTLGHQTHTCLMLDRDAVRQLHADLGLLLDIVGAPSADDTPID